MRRTFMTLAGVALFVVSMPAGLWAREPERTHDITHEDYFTIGHITHCVASPDGRFVAYTLLRWGEPDQARNTDLWVVETRSKQMRRLTFHPKNESSPHFSPDGQWIYFKTSRKRAGEKRPPYDGKTQVWRISVEGGEPFPVTRVKGGISGFDLSRDGRTLYYTKSEDQPDEEWQDLKSRYDELEYGHGKLKHSLLWKLDLVGWRAEKLIEAERFIRYFAVSPDQRRIALITDPDNRLITHEGRSRVDIYDAETKQITTLPDKLWRAEAPSPHGWLENPAWSSDGRSLAFVVSFDGYPSEVFVAEWNGTEFLVSKIERPHEVSVTGNLHWRPGSHDLCFMAEERARRRVYCVAEVRNGRQGAARALTPGDVVVHSYSFPESGPRVAVVKSDTRSSRDLFLISAETQGGEYERLTRMNPQIDTWKLPQISIVKWTGADGVPVAGILELPPDYQPGRPLPLIVELHGGPTACTKYHLRFWIYGRTLMAAKGYALLSPNYRGSTGYGDKFLTDLIGRENDVEVKDILAGVDAMIERGIADADRLGVMGWSNGGLLTNALITTTRRFKAASSGAGTLDMVIQWGLEDTPGHVINFMRGLPWDVPDAYRKASFTHRLHKITTPTIIHVGGSDPRVPPAHCRALFRALDDYLDVPTELIVYPGAGHGLTIYDHRKAKMEWDLAWFERYLPIDDSRQSDRPQEKPAPLGS